MNSMYSQGRLTRGSLAETLTSAKPNRPQRDLWTRSRTFWGPGVCYILQRAHLNLGQCTVALGEQGRLGQITSDSICFPGLQQTWGVHAHPGLLKEGQVTTLSAPGASLSLSHRRQYLSQTWTLSHEATLPTSRNRSLYTEMYFLCDSPDNRKWWQ